MWVKNVEIAVVGGGDSAAEEALYLTKYASRVHLLVRSDRLRASKIMQERVLSNDKIRVHWQALPISTDGDDVLRSVQIQNQKSGALTDLKVGGLLSSSNYGGWYGLYGSTSSRTMVSRNSLISR